MKLPSGGAFEDRPKLRWIWISLALIWITTMACQPTDQPTADAETVHSSQRAITDQSDPTASEVDAKNSPDMSTIGNSTTAPPASQKSSPGEKSDANEKTARRKNALDAVDFADECVDHKGCQEKYGLDSEPVTVKGRVVKAQSGLLYFSSVSTMLPLKAFYALPEKERFAAMRKPIFKRALDAAYDGQVVCDPNWWQGSGSRFVTDRNGRIQMTAARRFPRDLDPSGLDAVQKGDDIVVDGYYQSSFINPLLPTVSGCRLLERDD